MDTGAVLPSASAVRVEDGTTLATSRHEFSNGCGDQERFDSLLLNDLFLPPKSAEFYHCFLKEGERAVEPCRTATECLQTQNMGNDNPSFLGSFAGFDEIETRRQEPRRRTTKQARMERNRASAARSRARRRSNAQAKQQRVDELILSNRKLQDYISLLASRLATLRSDISSGTDILSSGTDIAQPHNQHSCAEGVLASM